MSGGADGTTQVVTEGGVTIEKHVNRDRPQHVAVLFEIRSGRPDEVRVRLRDPVPDQFSVGFHPDFGSEQWSRTDQTVDFEIVLDGGETCRTAYGVGNVPESEVSLLSAEPSVEVPRTEELDASVAEPEPGESGGTLGGLEDLDLDLAMDAEDVDLGDSVFDDQFPDVGRSDAPDAGEGDASQPVETASRSLRAEESQDEAEFFEEVFEDDGDVESESSPVAEGNNVLTSNVDIEPPESRDEASAEPASEPVQPPDEADSVAQPTVESSARGSAGWISASLKETIEELEAATAELAASTTDKRTTLAELQDQLATVRDELGAMASSLEAVEDQSRYQATVLEELGDSIRALESSIPDQESRQDHDGSELHATISDVAEEISLIKSSLASNLETAYQHRTDLDTIGAEIEKTGETVETIAGRTESITDELASFRELLRANADSLEALESNQLALQDAVHAMHDRLEELEDRLEQVSESMGADE